MAKKNIQEAELISLKSMLREILSDWTLPQEIIYKSMKTSVNTYLKEVSKGKSFDDASSSARRTLNNSLCCVQCLKPSCRKLIKDSIAFVAADEDLIQEEKLPFKSLLQEFDQMILTGESEEEAFRKTGQKADDLYELIIEARQHRDGILNVLPLYLSCLQESVEFMKRRQVVMSYFIEQIVQYVPPNIAAPRALKLAREQYAS